MRQSQCGSVTRKAVRAILYRTNSDRDHLLDILRESLTLQQQEDIPGLTYQQDGRPPHFHNEVRCYLDEIY
jgi:hypothetical protein